MVNENKYYSPMYMYMTSFGKPSFVKEVGNQGARLGRYVNESMDAPDYTLWYLLPFVISTILSYIIGWFVIPTDGKPIILDDKQKTQIPFMGYIIAYLFIPLIIGGGIGTAVYRIGFSIKNPKVAAWGMGIRFLSGK
jgi:hypothetical protein